MIAKTVFNYYFGHWVIEKVDNLADSIFSAVNQMCSKFKEKKKYQTYQIII